MVPKENVDQSEAENGESDQSGAAQSSYDADNENSNSDATTETSSDKNSLLSLSSTGTNVNYLNQVLDQVELASEPSDSSVVANLIEAIDVINDHSALPIGV